MNEQEAFWKGNFGDEYVDRVNGDEFIAAKINFFSQALRAAFNVYTVIDLGANRGLNANALKALLPTLNYTGVEIGDKAFAQLQSNQAVDNSIHSSIHNLFVDKTFDLALITGVLIHLSPNTLPEVYKLLYALSSKYIIISEYYNSVPVEIDYRGNKGKLFKRDFCQEFISSTGSKLIDYGFLYHADTKYKHADMTWFLLQK